MRLAACAILSQREGVRACLSSVSMAQPFRSPTIEGNFYLACGSFSSLGPIWAHTVQLATQLTLLVVGSPLPS
jgi:hypothetical protein